MCATGILEREQRKNGREMSEKIPPKISPKQTKDIKSQIPEVLQITSWTNTKETTSKYIRVKPLKEKQRYFLEAGSDKRW